MKIKNSKYGLYFIKLRRLLKFVTFGIWNSLFFPVRSIFFYKKLLEDSRRVRSDKYIEYEHKSEPVRDSAVLPIAFYLPQFHPIPENDKWWGTGFTEWTNVATAVPQFLGHYQPRLPGDLGFYDLRVEDVQLKQIEIAKNYGIHGFCYYYYWFGGKKLLEMPVDRHLNNKSFAMNYCLCWANENWTRAWDGGESEILIEQKHSEEDDLSFIKSLIPHFSDDRYIRYCGRPVLLVYRPTLLPDVKATVERWRKYCRDNGVGEIFLLVVHSRDVVDPRDIDFDGAVEFPPGGRAAIKAIGHKIPYVNAWHKGKVFDYNDLKKCFLSRSYRDYRIFRGIVTGWDNEARRPGGGRIYVNSTPESFGHWFEQCCHLACRDENAGERYVFINAWNEWAEGTYLEPDRRYGYAYIDQIFRVLTNFKISSRG